jgi:tripeptidyl-peptidase I
MYKWVFELVLICTAAIICSGKTGPETKDTLHLVRDLEHELEGKHTHVFKESMPLLSSRNDLIKIGRSEHDYVHEVVFAVKSRNMEELTRILHDVSDPHSQNYGMHMKKEEIDNLISNPEACTQLTAYLHANGATSLSETPGGGYITAAAPITVWERIFKTEFFVFQQTHLNGETHEVVRAEHYSVPTDIHDYVDAVINTIEMPILAHKKPKKSMSDVTNSERRRLASQFSPGFVDPNWLRYYYNMSDSHGSSLSTQAVYANGLDYFSPDDLADFQEIVVKQKLQPAISIGDHSSPDARVNDCGEGNLDLMYIMSLSPGSPTTYWYTESSIGEWLKTVASSPSVPLVLSISYGSFEPSTTIGELELFQNMAIQLGAMGVTILAGSGDSGAAFLENAEWLACRYLPMFPASCPYVISVGATMVRMKICLLREYV